MEDSRDSANKTNAQGKKRPSDAKFESNNPYFAELSSAKDVEEFKTKLRSIVKSLGFSNYMVVRQNGREIPIQLHSMPQEWVDNYHDSEFLEDDMALQLPLSMPSPQPVFRTSVNEYLSDLPLHFERKQRMAEIEELYRRYGFYDAYYAVGGPTIDGVSDVPGN